MGKTVDGLLPVRPTEGRVDRYACHEGNYAMFDLLEVARDEDKANAAKPAGASPNEDPPCSGCR